jgi:hypothetical protein
MKDTAIQTAILAAQVAAAVYFDGTPFTFWVGVSFACTFVTAVIWWSDTRNHEPHEDRSSPGL